MQHDDLTVDAEADDSQDSTAARRDDDEKLDYNYLIDMPIGSLGEELREALLAERDRKAEQLGQFRKKTPKDLWRDDLDAFMKQLQVIPLVCVRLCRFQTTCCCLYM